MCVCPCPKSIVVSLEVVGVSSPEAVMEDTPCIPVPGVCVLGGSGRPTRRLLHLPFGRRVGGRGWLWRTEAHVSLCVLKCS